MHDVGTPAKFVATVVITTKNRKSDLCRAIESALIQTVPLEVIVVDDGSTDGTAEEVASRFTGVKLIRSNSSKGYIAQRNLAAIYATTEFIFSVDDDAIFSTAHTVGQTLSNFTNPAIAAVAIPCIDVHKSPHPRQPFPRDGQQYIVADFIGTAYAVRSAVFKELGGFREELFHQGEERDFCARLYDAGYCVVLGNSDPVHHFESPSRDTRRMDVYGRRNDVLFAFQVVPLRGVLFHLVGTTVNGVRHGIVTGTLSRGLVGLMLGYAAGVPARLKCNPISYKSYQLLRQLRRCGCLPLSKFLIESNGGEPNLLVAGKR